MKFSFHVLILVILVSGCKQAIDPVKLIGTWKKDSVYRYYNGYGYTTSDFDEEPLHEYLSDQVLKMKLKNEERFFAYEIFGDSLFHLNNKTKRTDRFYVLKLNDEELVLRKGLMPVFPGKNQEHFEVQYLSRIQSGK
jgi:hypothetical protein